ncbi:hypothetical protein BROUX41_004476 [Berkeleyomyces rouxiae]
MRGIAGKLRVSGGYTQLPEDRFNMLPVRNGFSEFQISDAHTTLEQLANEQTNEVPAEHIENTYQRISRVCWCEGGQYNVQKNKLLSFADAQAPEVPRIQIARNNLTALSQAYNLYFAAFSHRLYVYRPRTNDTQVIPAKADLILFPGSSPEAQQIHGYQSTLRCHDANSVTTGFLGSLEIVVTAHDDGDVIAYATSHIEEYVRFLLRNEGRHPRPGDGEIIRPEPLFRFNVGTSAWGVAIHQKSRLVAVTSNRHEVTIFAPANDGSRGLLQVTHKMAVKTRCLMNLDREDLFIVIPFGRAAGNMPCIDFVENSLGFAHKIIVGDIKAGLWIADIWKRGTIARLYYELKNANLNTMIWSVRVLPESMFIPCVSHGDALKSTVEPFRFRYIKRFPNHGRLVDLTPATNTTLTGYEDQEYNRFYRIYPPPEFCLDLQARDPIQRHLPIHQLRDTFWGYMFEIRGEDPYEEYDDIDLGFLYEEAQAGPAQGGAVEIPDSGSWEDADPFGRAAGKHGLSKAGTAPSNIFQILRMKPEGYAVDPEIGNRGTTSHDIPTDDGISQSIKQNGYMDIENQTEPNNDPTGYSHNALSLLDEMTQMYRLNHSKTYLPGPRIFFPALLRLGLYPTNHEVLTRFLKRSFEAGFGLWQQDISELYKNGSRARLIIGMNTDILTMSPSPSPSDKIEGIPTSRFLTTRVPGAIVEPDLSRFNLSAVIPELSLVALGNFNGDVVLLTPTRVPSMFSSECLNPIRHVFAVELRLPKFDDESDVLMKNSCLVGLACSPLFEENEPANVHDELDLGAQLRRSSGDGWRLSDQSLDLDLLVPWRRRRKQRLRVMGATTGKWRLMLYYGNHMIITYILQRESSGKLMVV